jgi:hypothetical protein
MQIRGWGVDGVEPAVEVDERILHEFLGNVVGASRQPGDLDHGPIPSVVDVNERFTPDDGSEGLQGLFDWSHIGAGVRPTNPVPTNRSTHFRTQSSPENATAQGSTACPELNGAGGFDRSRVAALTPAPHIVLLPRQQALSGIGTTEDP